jgi:hypothetical protein
MDFKKLKEDLDKLNKPMINGHYNLCYADGYFAKSLVSKYGKPIVELMDSLTEWKKNKPMTDSEFQELEEELEEKIMEVNKLQKKYRSETGKDYVLKLYL